jgi:hypothetical protein
MSKPYSFSYSFSLSPPKAELHEYQYNEFMISLAPDWKQIPTAEADMLNFHSAELGAGITISADFYEIPVDKAQALAEKSISARIDAFEQLSPGRVHVLQRTIKPHSGGIGLELSLAVEVADEHVTIYLGYVTSRKILNFTLVCKPNTQSAIDLFNKIVPNFRPRLP